MRRQHRHEKIVKWGAMGSQSSQLPVFPLVGSIKVSPGLIRPVSSASITMRFPIRSFTEPPALKYSHLTRISQGSLCLAANRLTRTIGVLPTRSRMLSQILSGRVPTVGFGPTFWRMPWKRVSISVHGDRLSRRIAQRAAVDRNSSE